MNQEIQQYQSDDARITLDVRVENDTVWLTQAQIGMLFGVQKAAISKHLKNIFNFGELCQESVVSILETTANDGKTYDVREDPAVHDRFLLLDGTLLYTFGASFKDLGKKLFCFSLMESGAVVAAVRGMVVFGGVDVNLRNITNQRRCGNSPTPVQEFANAGAGICQRRCRNLPTPMREWSNARTGMNQRVYYDSFIQVVAYLSIVQIAKFCVSTD